MLNTAANFLFLLLLRDDIQSELFHHLSRDGGEADWPVVSWVLLLAIFEDWSDTGFSPVLGHFCCSPRPFKMMESGSAMTPAAPSALVGASHWGPLNLCVFSLFK